MKNEGYHDNDDVFYFKARKRKTGEHQTPHSHSISWIHVCSHFSSMCLLPYLAQVERITKHKRWHQALPFYVKYMQRKYSYFWLCLSWISVWAYLKAYNGQFNGWTAFITFGLKANSITSDMFQIISPDKVNFCSDCESELMTRIEQSKSSHMEESSWGLKRDELVLDFHHQSQAY